MKPIAIFVLVAAFSVAAVATSAKNATAPGQHKRAHCFQALPVLGLQPIHRSEPWLPRANSPASRTSKRPRSDRSRRCRIPTKLRCSVI